ncbi:uncharacterized protein K444DRAFT_609843 [Hyaloscypha bicolor E]|uniref:Cytochrome P450 n=1 Tax=Hyaloscypha bicolor E TaxID=1095630 RepID=A0A2J6TKV3_9HELO|nr:uncharacterized protein K444DRAFT_609843 [Hyaloscypha bicolor E]PMD63651.1 hypothetical protein K444DRAFT_609843 [Hyaloscypha bicolor E]
MIEANLTSPEEALSHEQIIEDILQFIISGHETSTGPLTWTRYALAMNPSMLGRFLEDILSATKNGVTAWTSCGGGNGCILVCL